MEDSEETPVGKKGSWWEVLGWSEQHGLCFQETWYVRIQTHTCMTKRWFKWRSSRFSSLCESMWWMSGNKVSRRATARSSQRWWRTRTSRPVTCWTTQRKRTFMSGGGITWLQRDTTFTYFQRSPSSLVVLLEPRWSSSVFYPSLFDTATSSFKNEYTLSLDNKFRTLKTWTRSHIGVTHCTLQYVILFIFLHCFLWSWCPWIFFSPLHDHLHLRRGRSCDSSPLQRTNVETLPGDRRSGKSGKTWGMVGGIFSFLFSSFFFRHKHLFINHCLYCTHNPSSVNSSDSWRPSPKRSKRGWWPMVAPEVLLSCSC